MHQSGEWISAFTSESGAVDKTGSRRHRTWQRPAEFTPGLTQGPALDIPWVSWRDELKPLETYPPDTEWVPGPKRNKSILFSLFFLAPNVDHQATIASVSKPGDRVLDRGLPMSNGETLWLHVRHKENSADENKGIASVERQLRGIGISGNLDDVHAWALWITTAVQGMPLFVHFPLGRRHFTVTPPSP